MSAKITDIDRGLAERIKLLSGKWHVKVGVLEDAEPRDDNATNAEIASFHEFGLGVPERSFVRRTADEKLPEIRATQRAVGQEILKGNIDGEIGAERIGVVVAGLMKQRISDFIPPALSEERIRQKGSSMPLIDTGQLRSSIASQVQKGAIKR